MVISRDGAGAPSGGGAGPADDDTGGSSDGGVAGPDDADSAGGGSGSVGDDGGSDLGGTAPSSGGDDDDPVGGGGGGYGSVPSTGPDTDPDPVETTVGSITRNRGGEAVVTESFDAPSGGTIGDDAGDDPATTPAPDPADVSVGVGSGPQPSEFDALGGAQSTVDDVSDTLPGRTGEAFAAGVGVAAIPEPTPVTEGLGTAIAGGAALAGAGILASRAVRDSELDVGERVTNELDVGQSRREVSELTPSSGRVSELAPGDTTPTTTEIGVGSRVGGSEIDVPTETDAPGTIATTGLQIGREQEAVDEEEATITRDDLVDELPDVDQPGPSVREQIRRDDLQTPAREFVTGESAVVGREEVGQSAIVGSGTASQISEAVQEPAVEPSASALGVGVGVGSASDPLLAGAEEDRPAATDPFDAVRERVLGETATETATGVDTAPQTDTATAGASATDSRAEPVVEPIEEVFAETTVEATEAVETTAEPLATPTEVATETPTADVAPPSTTGRTRERERPRLRLDPTDGRDERDLDPVGFGGETILNPTQSLGQVDDNLTEDLDAP